MNLFHAESKEKGSIYSLNNKKEIEQGLSFREVKVQLLIIWRQNSKYKSDCKNIRENISSEMSTDFLWSVVYF